MFVLLADDGSGKSLPTDTEKCNYWFNHFSKKTSFPPVEFDLSEDETFPCHAILSSIRKPTITPRTTPIRFPVDFFKSAQMLIDSEFVGGNLIHFASVVECSSNVGSNSVERSPQDFELFGRTVEVNNEQGPRGDDLHRSISRR